LYKLLENSDSSWSLLGAVEDGANKKFTIRKGTLPDRKNIAIGIRSIMKNHDTSDYVSSTEPQKNYSNGWYLYWK
jgi:hypothetical protein